VAVALARFDAALPSGCHICLDTAVLIYHLEHVQPYSDLTVRLVERLAGGDATAVVSTVTVTELLTAPFREAEPDAADAAEGFLASLPGCEIRPVSYEVARTAARIRARTGLRTPDALVAATARDAGATHLLTNDEGLRRLGADGAPVVVLGDYAGSR